MPIFSLCFLLTLLHRRKEEQLLSFACVSNTQCGKFSIFLSLRFYVKTISENATVQKNAIFAISGALNILTFGKFQPS